MYTTTLNGKTIVYSFLVFIVISFFSTLALTESLYQDFTYHAYSSVNANFVYASVDENISIDATAIVVVPNNASSLGEDNNSLIKYIIQPGDTLSEIARDYGTTVNKLKEINNLQNTTLRVGMTLYIASVDGIIYTLKEKTNPMVFANKWSLPSLDDFMSVNGFREEMRLLEKGEEIFIPAMSNKRAIELGLLEKPAPKPIPKPVAKHIPKKIPKKQTTAVTRKIYQPTTSSAVIVNAIPKKSKKKKDVILSKWVDTHRTQNGFAACNCTEQAAARSDRLFPRPYKNQNRQYRTIKGDARKRNDSAIRAGLYTSKTPSIGAIVVFGPTSSNRYGHVSVVTAVDYKAKTITIKEQNFLGKCVNNTRLIYMNDNMNKAIYHNIEDFIPVQRLPEHVENTLKKIRKK